MKPIYTLIILFFSITCIAQNNIQKAINTFANDPVFQNASISISVLDLESGRQIAAHDPKRSLIPASTLKVVTTATALAILGKDYNFKTVLQYDGNIDNEGTLNGNIYIKGFGDPTLGSDQMEGTPSLFEVLDIFVDEIKKKGIKNITGNIIGDGTYFPSSVNATSWQWNDLGNYYASGAWGLNIHENLYHLHLKQTSQLGNTPSIAAVVPPVPMMQIFNELTAAPKNTGDNAYIFGAPYTDIKYVRGTIPVGNGTFSIKGAIPNPPLFAAFHLFKALRKSGITVHKVSTTALDLQQKNILSQKERRNICTHYSPELKEIVNRTNRESVNLYCEVLLKTIGKEKKGKATTKAGIEVVKSYWKEQHFDQTGFYMEDGSGLSARNAVSAQHLTSLLQLIAKDSTLYPTFHSSLSLAGINGTLKNMLKNKNTSGKIAAKSGSIKRVRSYTGYVTTQNGKQLVFAIIANNFNTKSSIVRKKMEKIMATLIIEY